MHDISTDVIIILVISNKMIKQSIIQLMKQMIPFVPHLAHECLVLMGCKEIDKWPKINKNQFNSIKLAVQINGKTRDIMTVQSDLNEKEINKKVLKDSKANKYIKDRQIKKTIFIKNKIINYIIS